MGNISDFYLKSEGSGSPSVSEGAHYARHRDGGLGRFGAAVMFPTQTADACLLLIFEQEDLVDHRHMVLQLDLH